MFLLDFWIFNMTMALILGAGLSVLSLLKLFYLELRIFKQPVEIPVSASRRRTLVPSQEQIRAPSH